MTNHTPDKIKTQEEEFAEVLERTVACALRLCDEQESVDIHLFHNENRETVNKITKGWLSCKGDSQDSYERALCYGNLGLTYDCNHFDQIAELHYGSMKPYWGLMVNYINKSLSGLI